MRRAASDKLRLFRAGFSINRFDKRFLLSLLCQ